MANDQFWKVANENRTKAQLPFEQASNSSNEITFLEYKTPFMDHEEGETVFTSSTSILRMRIERAEVPWTELQFEEKSQSNSIYADRVYQIPAFQRKLLRSGLRKL